MTFQKVPISSFLKERESRIKPNEANKMGLKRLNKINFSGEIHLSDKNTNTNMILIKPGDLVISGINVEKGAVAVYQGKEDIIATIHYSAYIYNKNKIDLEYLKIFLMSEAFRETINSQTRGGIKTEIKPKTFLKLEIYLPDLKTQVEIRNKLKEKIVKVNNYAEIQENDFVLLSKLRQSILQSAVQGKLVKQDPKDEPASELLKKIKAEKEKLIKEGKIRKDKPLTPISEDEIPYELPRGWEWVRLQEVFDVRDGTHDTPKYFSEGYPLVTSKNIYDGKFDMDNIRHISKEDYTNILKRSKVDKGDILFAMIGSIGNPVLIDFKPKFAIKNVALFKYYNSKLSNPKFLLYFLKHEEIIMREKSSGAVQSFVPLNYLREYLFPLPPFSEQKRIAEKVDKLMASCAELETQVKENKRNAEKLMGAVLKEGFEK